MKYNMSFLQEVEQGVWRLKVLVQPGAGKDKIAGVHADRIKVMVRAPAVDNKANRALCFFLSRCLGVKKSQVRIYKGFTARKKEVLVFQTPVSAFEELLPEQE